MLLQPSLVSKIPYRLAVLIILLIFMVFNFILYFVDNLKALDQLVEIAKKREQGAICQYLNFNMETGMRAYSGTAVLGFGSTRGKRGVGIRAFCTVLQGGTVETIDLDSGCEAAVWIHQYVEDTSPLLLPTLADAAFELCPKPAISRWLSDEMLAVYKTSNSADSLETFSLRLIELPLGSIVAYATFIQDNLAVDNSELALQLSEKAVMIYPDHARLRYLHGLALAKEGQTERAISELCLASHLRQDESSLAYARAAEKLAEKDVDCSLFISPQR